jgi:hypothetical protein
MTSLWETISTEKVRPIEFAGGASGVLPDDSRAAVRDALHRDGLVVLRDVPVTADALVGCARQLGTPQPRVVGDGVLAEDDPMYWINDITFQKKGGGQLKLHTAGAHETVEPRFHLLFMVEESDLPVADGQADNGQSQFGRVDDAVARMVALFGEDVAHAALDLLMTTPISTNFPEDAPRAEPIIARDEEGTWTFRYWRRILEHAELADLGDERLHALAMFDEALNHESVKFEVMLHRGDLVVLDNRRTAHGRRAFPAFAMRDGREVTSARRIFNMHVTGEL